MQGHTAAIGCAATLAALSSLWTDASAQKLVLNIAVSPNKEACLACHALPTRLRDDNDESKSFSIPVDASQIDDMRPEFGESFQFPFVKTPNIDELATEGIAFQRAYCQAATCGVSRSSLLSGRRVDTTGVYANGGCIFKSGGKNWTSLPHYFRNNGFQTWGGGKVRQRHCLELVTRQRE